ncbi:TIR domain-containing protein [Nocardia sp. NRRL S-836]|uniref:TIR domain-containing protein n=1 Tax=Nocardia sp. NRRL S-836 TaxID=1519492 RepID=UPI0018D1F5A0|nr:TIR domain-containing protein [Nocardia sp. NRRL S-836]
MEPTPGKIFISYRREGTAGEARALAHDLADVFGPAAVFLDTSLPGGAEWPARLRQELADAPVVLALIGPTWLMAADEWNRRRIDADSDWVRQEIEAALRGSATLLIPVLLEGSAMPPLEALPASLAGLVERQARHLAHETWSWQLAALVEDIERHTGWRRHSAERPTGPTLAQYTRAQLRRVESMLLIDGLRAGSERKPAGAPAEFVMPDLLPFQVEPPATNRLTMTAAEQLKRAVIDRARYSAEGMLARAATQRVVIVGGPGSGKTTLLSMMTRLHASASLSDTTARIPVLLRVRDLALRTGDSLTAELVRDAARRLDLTLDRDFFHRLFASGRALFLIDGIDEAPDVSSRNELLAKIDLFADRYSSATVVVSSRIVGYDHRLLGREFEHFELAPFSDAQARQVLTGLLQARGADAEQAVTRVLKDPRLSALTSVPLLLSIVGRIVVERGTADRLPREKHALYDTAVEMMLADWDAQRGVEIAERPRHLERCEIRRALETVAHRVHAGLVQRGDTSAIEASTLESELTDALEEFVDPHRARWQARELLRYAVARAGLLVESGPERFAFCHRALQEHLAACAISARPRSGVDPIVRHFAENGIHAPKWQNANLLLISMQRGERARRIIEHVLDAASPHEQWLHRDLLLVGEALGESPALVSGIDDNLATRVVGGVLDIVAANRVEVGYFTNRAASRVLRAWRDTPLNHIARRLLSDVAARSSPVDRYCAQALVGSVESAGEALVEVMITAPEETADLAALATRDLHVDLGCTPEVVDRIVGFILARAALPAASGHDLRLPYTAGELVGLFSREEPLRGRTLRIFLGWLGDEATSACLRGVAATGLGWLGENSAEVREGLVRMLADRRISAGDRSWPAYALFRFGGGEAEVVEVMLGVLADDARILCGWAQIYLSKFATRSVDVVRRLQKLAEDNARPTLPWVLAALARLSGLDLADIARLESIAVTDPALERRTGAIETLVACAEMAPEWRRRAAERLVDVLSAMFDVEPSDEAAVDAVASGMRALGSLGTSFSAAWDLCLKFIEHESEELRIAATEGIGGLHADTQVCSRIVSALDLPVATGKVRGGLVDALHRVLASDRGL